MMKRLIVAAAILMVAAPVFAQKPCEELKQEIEAKLEAKGVKNYSLKIVPNENVDEEIGDGKVVGSCDGGTQKIIYSREK